jgi:hypothetical protein
VAHGVGPEFKAQYHSNNNKKHGKEIWVMLDARESALIEARSETYEGNA